MRKLIVVALASSTFGGVIGALATAATESQASPTAIAAAVQRVQDQKADAALTTISNRVGDLRTSLGTINTELTQLDTDARATTTAVSSGSSLSSSDDTSLWTYLSDICRGVWQSAADCAESPPPTPFARHGASVSATAAKVCPAHYTQAVIGGAQKCLHAGEYCSHAEARQYRRYRFVCERVRGTYRLEGS